MTHNPQWAGRRLSLNVILDLGIFLGEFAINENPVLRWEMDTRTESGRTRIDEQFQRTVVAGAKPLFSFPRDVTRQMYDFCHSQCEASYLWKESLFQYGSRSLRRQFVTKTLRHIGLSARGDFEAANAEWVRDDLAR